jgi:phenylacetate-coenzyme A ligase PaaK-like adenylate-forming protein
LDPERIYLTLPVPLQNLACSLVGWRIEHGRYRGQFPEVLRSVESRTFANQEEIEAFRDERLRRFVHFCGRHVPYYRRRFSELGIDWRDVRSLDDLKHLPILTKDEIKEHQEEFTPEGVDLGRKVMVHTGGSTGSGLRFPTTLPALQEQWAVWWRYRRWHGIERRTWCAHFMGRSVVPVSQTRPPFWRYNHPGRQILFSGYHMSRRNLDTYLNELRRKQPPWFHGYPSLLALLADRALESGFDLGYTPRSVTIGSENLLEQQSGLIERAFGVRPKEHYGSAEATANFSQCPEGTLHVDEDFAATEFVPSETDDGALVVGTNFTNVATPLIRYSLHDVATISNAACPCGRPGRTVVSVDGRLEDYIVLKDGTRLGRLGHIFKDMVAIREAQIFQRVPGEVVVRVVRRPEYDAADEALLLNEARKRLGADTDMRIDYVDAVERSERGKLRMVVSELAHGRAFSAGRRGGAVGSPFLWALLEQGCYI